ncbi:MAG TPA: MmgE/PrpD family protein [Stellaceae bacterium]|nr:MmgE/PrpD family protein [Stellaceae bacterium]
MARANTGNGARIAAYIAAAPARNLPAEIEDAARLCLADWLGCAIGAGDEPAGRIVRETAAGWKSGGGATVLYGGTAAAPFAALANGTLAHCLDFDDTHIGAVTHTSAPVWAATLALGEELGADESAMLRAYVAGFETASRLGRGLGEAVTAHGFHGTGVFGRLGAAAAAAALLRLDEDKALNALGAAATQAGGLTASFGTMAKPFHAGKAAMDGVLAAQLAANGLAAATGVLEPGGGLDNVFVQDGSAAITPSDFTGWEILNNSFKPYAACHLTHPAVDAAREMAPGANALAGLRMVKAEIGLLADQVTGRRSGAPTTGLEGKFDIKYCVALGLHGRTLSAADFAEPWSADPAVLATAGKVTVVADPAIAYTEARVALEYADGRSDARHIPIGKGHPGNSMGWDDMAVKFDALVRPRLGARGEALFGLVRAFGSGGVLAEIREIVGRV